MDKFNCDTTQLCLQNNSAWNKDDIQVVIEFPVNWDTLHVSNHSIRDQS